MTSKDVHEQQLQLLLALDKARDSIGEQSEPRNMFDQIVRVLRQHFQADACGLLLTEDTTHDEDIIIATGIPDDMAQELAQQAIECATPSPLEHRAWAYSLGLRIVLDEDEQISGGFFLANKQDTFDEDDIALLTIAEKQIDSAVMQARTLWRLMERQRELEAIYQIDRLRDNALDEDGLFGQFVAIVLENMQASYCTIFSKHLGSNTLQVRALIDKSGMDDGFLQKVKQHLPDLQNVQVLALNNDKVAHFLGAPLIVAGLRMGAIVVGRDKTFHNNAYRLMHAMTSQMDSALAKSHITQQLAQRTRELEAIYRIDSIRDQEVDFDLMMQRVLGELCDAVDCETGYIMLYNSDEEAKLELRATARDSILNDSASLAEIETISKEALDREKVVVRNDKQAHFPSILATPLILNERVIGVFGALNSRHGDGFTKDDSRMLSAITSQVDTAIFERLERRRMRRVLSRSVDPKVLDALLKKADDSLLAGERVMLSVLFADLRGSTEWAERTDAEDLVKVLNTFLGAMTDVIFKYGGTLDKFVGDEVIALFGAPVIMQDHAYQAAQCALEMQAVHHQLQEDFESKGYELPPMGIGIASGDAIAGEFGPPIRTDFTAMGRVMNLGSRLCSAAKGGETILSQTTYEQIDNLCEADKLPAITPKGINQSVDIYALKKVT
jgi:adenylate cyclase